MKAMDDGGNYQGLRLRNAAAVAFAALDEYGFQLRDSQLDAWRGASVVAANDTVAIVVGADWYERELSVSIQVAGAKPLPVESLIPDLRGVTRLLPRNARRGVLQRRLDLIVEALRSQAPEVLEGGHEALTRVLKAGASPM
jgi:hypothetical protein